MKNHQPNRDWISVTLETIARFHRLLNEGEPSRNNNFVEGIRNF
jgi:hypothetical protein